MRFVQRRPSAVVDRTGNGIMTTWDISIFSGVSAPGSSVDDRCRLLAQILDDCDTDCSEVERKLGLRLSDYHWAAVLCSVPGGGLTAEDLVRFALTVGQTVGGARPLVAMNGASEVWMWTRWARPPASEAIAAVRDRLSAVDGLQVGVGPIASGAAGFRHSLLGARAAWRSADPSARWCTYEDVSAVSLLTKDDERTRWFLAEVLGELGGSGSRYATLRETLRLYLATGRSRQQVAAAMYINRNTVAYRVQKATELLGRPIGEDDFEVRLALEVARSGNLSARDRSDHNVLSLLEALPTIG